MKFDDQRILTIEEIIDRINSADDFTSKCRYRVGVLIEHFEQLSNNASGFEFKDHILWAMGIKEICADMLKDLDEANDLTCMLEKNINLYSLDMEKIKKEEKYLKSIGIDKKLVTAEVAA